MFRSPFPLLTLGLLTIGCAGRAPSTSDAAGPASASSSLKGDNPLYRPSPLPFQAPPFDRIRVEHYQPALEQGMREQLVEVKAIAGQGAQPTFENTIVPLERSGALLTRATSVFFAMAGANTNDTIQQVETEEAPKLAAHTDAIYLDGALFRRVKSIYDREGSLKLDPEQKRLVERYYRDFVRAGAGLSEADKVRLRALNQKEAELVTDFQQRLLAATKAMIAPAAQQ